LIGRSGVVIVAICAASASYVTRNGRPAGGARTAAAMDQALRSFSRLSSPTAEKMTALAGWFVRSSYLCRVEPRRRAFDWRWFFIGVGVTLAAAILTRAVIG